MRFLGGFLKFLSILLMIIGTAACAVVIVMAEYQIEACIVMGGVWLLVIFVGLNIWGTGLALGQISKLKKRIAQLEQRPMVNPYYPYPQAAPVVHNEPSAPAVAEAAHEESAPVAEPVRPKNSFSLLCSPSLPLKASPPRQPSPGCLL